MQVSKTDYLKIEFDENIKMLKATWYPESEELEDEDFKKEIYRWKEMINKYMPDFLLVDSREMKYTISPATQEWFVSDIFTAYAKVGVKRNAFVESEEIFTSVSIQQTMEENENAPFATMYFDNVEEAKEWLLGKS